MSKINELTTEQERRLVEFRWEWLQIGLTTGPADMGVVNRVMAEFYRRQDNKPPYIWRVSSPLMANLVINILKKGLGSNLENNLRSNLEDNLWGNLRDNLGSNLGSDLEDNLGSNLRDNLWDNLGSNLGSNLWGNLRGNLGDNLRGNLGDNLRDNLRDNLWNNLRNNLRGNLGDNLRNNLGDNLGSQIEYNLTYFWGSLDVFWIAFYMFPHLHLRPLHTDSQMILLNLWADLARSCFWWWPYEGIVFVSDRPSTINKDERGRLHNPTGPSVAFVDGYRVYHVHGVEMRGELIEDHGQITTQVIDNVDNVEQRRVLIDIYGANRWLQDSGAVEVSRDERGILWRKNVVDDEPVVMVEVVNSSGEDKHYWLRVPPTMTTAAEAVAWTFDTDDYTPEVET